jgi:phosphoglycolate phosphatase
MKRLLIFDFDGTLIDSAQDIADSVNELLHTQGIDPLRSSDCPPSKKGRRRSPSISKRK